MLVYICVLSCSVMPYSLWPHGLQPARLHCPWDYPGKNSGVGCHFLLQRTFPTQGRSLHPLCLLHWQADPLRLSCLICIYLSINNTFPPMKRDGATGPLSREHSLWWRLFPVRTDLNGFIILFCHIFHTIHYLHTCFQYWSTKNYFEFAKGSKYY